MSKIKLKTLLSTELLFLDSHFQQYNSRVITEGFLAILHILACCAYRGRKSVKIRPTEKF